MLEHIVVCVSLDSLVLSVKTVSHSPKYDHCMCILVRVMNIALFTLSNFAYFLPVYNF